MKTARRAIWTSASAVTSPETIASGREHAVSSSTTIGRRRDSRTTRPATTAAIRAAASRESVRAAAAGKAKIPHATPRDDETKTRNRDFIQPISGPAPCAPPGRRSVSYGKADVHESTVLDL